MRLFSGLCLVGVVSMVMGIADPGAQQRANPILFELQQGLADMSYFIWPDGQNWDTSLNMALMMASTDLCKIKNKRQQGDDSIIMGQKCKDVFSELYNKNECSGGICDMMTWLKEDSRDFIESIITARTVDNVFGVIESEMYVPMMEWACKCSNDMMDSWMECKDGIGEAKIWGLMRMTDAIDLNADYLQGETFKDFWENFIVNEMPWEAISTFVERMMGNLCQDSGVKNEQCYDYFFDTIMKLYQWYVNSMSPRDPPAKVDGYPGYCSKFDLSVLSGNVGFSDLKSALTTKFCVEECSGLYQDVLLGCCTASMINDREMEAAIVDIATGFVDAMEEMFPSDDTMEGDDMMIPVDDIFSYAKDAIDMLRNPTCEETSVSYELNNCGEDSGSHHGDGDDMDGGSCSALKSQLSALQKRVDMSCGGGESGDPCAGLTGRKKMMCKRKNKDGDDKKEGGGRRGGGGRGGGGRGGGRTE